VKSRMATSSIRARATTCATSTRSYAAAKAKAAKVVKASYTVSYLAHARMEPGNTTAMVTPGRADLWIGDQPTAAPDQVRQAVAVAKTLNGRPVKLIWSLEEDMRLGERYRQMGVGRFEAALD
jgi:isoquinoline 1-oxidoreductase subunit beta